MKFLTISLLLLCAVFIRIQAQEAPKIKFEKVSNEELSMKSYPNDTTADAVILYDDGSSYVKYDLEKGFMLTYERFVRIKILKQNGVEWGNFHLSLYSHNNNIEEISHVKGTTINLENGKIVKNEMKKGAIFKERENKYWESVKFSLPSVKVGSVIDVQYTISSEMTWNLRNWKFQYSIPVKWSQYRIVYPEYFTYNQQFMGYHMLLFNKRSMSSERISYTERQESNSAYSAPPQPISKSIEYQTNIFEYAANEIPALKAEPYLSSLDNYTTQLKFELANANFAKVGGSFHNYNTSWNDVAKELNDEENFGKQIKSGTQFSDEVAELTKGIQTEDAKLAIIFNHVQKSMKWDGYKTIYTDKNLKKVYSDKTGNSADINLMLIAMLVKAGINARPVVLSTRENGILSVSHASMSDCNYVVAVATLDGKRILLDATEPSLQQGFLPFRCLNGEGHMLSNELSESIPLSNPKSAASVVVNLELKDGKISGKYQKNESGLTAFDFRKSLKTAGGKKEYFDKIKNSSADMDYIDYKYSNVDSLSEPVLIEYNFAKKEKLEEGASVLYIDPVILEKQVSNPFTSPSRLYPVDYGVPSSLYYNLQLTIPAGYMVEELPKDAVFILDGKGGQFQYQITQLDQKISVNMVLSINKPIFVAAEYAALRNFYDKVISKQGEQIVLKKKTT